MGYLCSPLQTLHHAYNSNINHIRQVCNCYLCYTLEAQINHMSFQKQITLNLKRIAFLSQLMSKSGEVTSDAETVDLVEYYNDHKQVECEVKLLDMKSHLDELYRDSIATSPFASPTQISINLNGRAVVAFLIRPNNPRLVLCQDRVLEIADNGLIIKELDLLEYFKPSTNAGTNVL